MDGVEIAGRFAFAPNSLSYCGNRTFGEIFGKYLAAKTPANRKAAENAVKLFKAHYAYLQLIAKATKRQPFDAKVTEAFWLGNELLDEIDVASLRQLITTKFVRKGLLSKRKAAMIAKSVPDGAVAHHSFHPLFLGSITGVVDRSVKTADMCRPAWGKVIAINCSRHGKAGNGSALDALRGSNERISKAGLASSICNAVIDSQELVQNNGKLAIVPARRIVKLQCGGQMLVGMPKIGEIIATHWDFAVMKISVMAAAELEEAAKRNIEAANAA